MTTIPSGTYTYLIFENTNTISSPSATIIFPANVTCSVLVVGAGGNGYTGNNAYGGGGGGGGGISILNFCSIVSNIEYTLEMSSSLYGFSGPAASPILVYATSGTTPNSNLAGTGGLGYGTNFYNGGSGGEGGDYLAALNGKSNSCYTTTGTFPFGMFNISAGNGGGGGGSPNPSGGSGFNNNAGSGGGGGGSGGTGIVKTSTYDAEGGGGGGGGFQGGNGSNAIIDTSGDGGNGGYNSYSSSSPTATLSFGNGGGGGGGSQHTIGTVGTGSNGVIIIYYQSTSGNIYCNESINSDIFNCSGSINCNSLSIGIGQSIVSNIYFGTYTFTNVYFPGGAGDNNYVDSGNIVPNAGFIPTCILLGIQTTTPTFSTTASWEISNINGITYSFNIFLYLPQGNGYTASPGANYTVSYLAIA